MNIIHQIKEARRAKEPIACDGSGCQLCHGDEVVCGDGTAGYVIGGAVEAIGDPRIRYLAIQTESGALTFAEVDATHKVTAKDRARRLVVEFDKSKEAAPTYLYDRAWPGQLLERAVVVLREVAES